MAPCVWTIIRVVVSNIERDDFYSGKHQAQHPKILAAVVWFTLSRWPRNKNSAVHLSSGCLADWWLRALWQYSARLLDSGLEAGAARALDTKVTVSGSRLNLLKPSYGVASVSAEGPLGDPPFFSAASVGGQHVVEKAA